MSFVLIKICCLNNVSIKCLVCKKYLFMNEIQSSLSSFSEVSRNKENIEGSMNYLKILS